MKEDTLQSTHEEPLAEFALVSTARGFAFGQARYPRGGRFGPIEQPFLTLCLCFSGETRISPANEPSRTLHAGESALFYNSAELYYDYPPGVDSHIGWVEIQPRLPPRLIRTLLSLLPLKLSPDDRLKQLLQLGLELKSDMRGSTAGIEFNNALGAATLGAWLYAADNQGEQPAIPAQARLAQSYIRRHFLQPLTLDDIARETGVSAQYLTRIFRQNFHITPIRYLWQLRALTGIRALRDSHSSITAIATGCGYQTPYHFSRHVKQLTGLAPSALRARLEQQVGTDEMPEIPILHFPPHD